MVPELVEGTDAMLAIKTAASVLCTPSGVEGESLD